MSAAVPIVLQFQPYGDDLMLRKLIVDSFEFDQSLSQILDEIATCNEVIYEPVSSFSLCMNIEFERPNASFELLLDVPLRPILRVRIVRRNLLNFVVP